MKFSSSRQQDDYWIVVPYINRASLTRILPPGLIWSNWDHCTGATAYAKVHTTRDHMIDRSSQFIFLVLQSLFSWLLEQARLKLSLSKTVFACFFRQPGFSEPNCSAELMTPLYQPTQSFKSETEKGEGSLLKGGFTSHLGTLKIGPKCWWSVKLHFDECLWCQVTHVKYLHRVLRSECKHIRWCWWWFSHQFWQCSSTKTLMKLSVAWIDRSAGHVPSIYFRSCHCFQGRRQKHVSTILLATALSSWSFASCIESFTC